MITFVKRDAGTYNASTDTFSGASTTSVDGAAVEVRSNSSEVAQFEKLGLAKGDALTLLFTPETYGTLPELDSTVEWGGETLVVRTIQRIAPDGVAIAARVGCSR